MSDAKRPAVSDAELDAILEQVYEKKGETGKFDTPGENREQELDDILKSLGMGERPSGPAVQFVPDVDRVLAPKPKKKERQPRQTQPSVPPAQEPARQRAPQRAESAPAAEPVRQRAPQRAESAPAQEPVRQKAPQRAESAPAQEPARQRAPQRTEGASVQNAAPQRAPQRAESAPAQEPVRRKAPENPARPNAPQAASQEKTAAPAQGTKAEDAEKKEETTTLELPSIKQFSEAQHQRLEAIKQEAAEEALRNNARQENPYTQVALANASKEQSALFGEVDDRFRAFFSKSVAQDSPELENAAYENEKKRRGPGKWKRLLQNAVNDHEEEFITGEYDTLLPTKAHRSEKGGKTRVQVQPDEPQVTESGTTLHGFTISMELDAPEAAPEGMPGAEGVDYNHASDAPAVAAALKNMRITRLLRTIVTGLVTVVLVYLGLSSRAGGLPPFAALDPHTQPLTFLIVNFVLLAIAAVACLSTLGTGIAGLWSRPTTDTFPALAVAGAGIQNLTYLFAAGSFDPEKTTLFAPAAAFLLFAGSLGKWLQSRIVSGNFDMASGGLERAAAFIVPNRALTKKVCSGLGEPDPVLLVSRPTGLVRGFVQQSFSAHANDATAQKLSCAALGAAVAAAVVCGVRAKDAFDALSGFAGALCVIMPLASSLVYATPALRLHRAASQVGAVIPGPSAIGELGRVNTILLSAKDLFPAACVRLHGIKTFEKERIDLAILYATSILAQQCDTLRDTFMTLVDNKKEVLYKLESPQTEPGFGFTAWIDHKRIIIGSREMMKRHDVEIPSMDYENKYTQNGERSAIYLAVSGKAFGMFIVSYAPDLLESVGRAGISVLIQTEDFNITEPLVRATYNLPQTAVKVLSQSERSALTPHTAFLRESEGLMTHAGTCTSFIGGMQAAAQAAESEASACLVQKVSVFAGIALALVLGFAMGLPGLSLAALVLYQLVWGMLTSLIPLLRR